jgi:malonyl-CoA decarboxylase
MARTWFDRLLKSIADRGRAWALIPSGLPPLEEARQLCFNLLSEKGEASGAALATALLSRYRALGEDDRAAFHAFLAAGFTPEPERLRAAAAAYCEDPTPVSALALTEAAEPPRRELLRRFNMGPGGTATLVQLRSDLLRALPTQPALLPLDADLQYLFQSWFNRGFLDIRRIDWNTPAAILEKLITYEAVHEIQGWEDLRRRLAPDRRCFAFFHPALHDEPLIFVEVALVRGIAAAIEPLLAGDVVDGQATPPNTAIFYSISNCQRGLKGISFGNFLIKQVVEELRQELPSLKRFATLSPIPGFRRWLGRRIADGTRGLIRAVEREALTAAAGFGGAKKALRLLLERPDWSQDASAAAALKPVLTRLCAQYLTASENGQGPSDPVARFHLGNGARLEQINWRANLGVRGMAESYGLMANYLYDLDRIEANHEAFVHRGQVACGEAVTELLREERPAVRGVGQLLSFRRRPQRPPARAPTSAP